MKIMIFLVLALFSANAFSAYVYCGDKITRVQIEGGQYLLFLQPESGSVTPLNIGAVGDTLADRYFSMALTAYSVGDPFIIRYSDPSSSSCADLRSESSKITYITVKK